MQLKNLGAVGRHDKRRLIIYTPHGIHNNMDLRYNYSHVQGTLLGGVVGTLCFIFYNFTKYLSIGILLLIYYLVNIYRKLFVNYGFEIYDTI